MESSTLWRVEQSQDPEQFVEDLRNVQMFLFFISIELDIEIDMYRVKEAQEMEEEP